MGGLLTLSMALLCLDGGGGGSKVNRDQSTPDVCLRISEGNTATEEM